MTVGLLVGWGLVAVGLSWGLLRLLLWDTEGVSPDEALSPSARRRREQGVSEQDRLAHRAAFLRSCEDGVCCCSYHGQVWCAVHNDEGEAVGGDAA